MESEVSEPTHPQRRGAVWNGLGTGMSQSLELVVGPLLFALLGVWIDSRLGTAPWFAVGLLVFSAAGATISAYYRFQARAEAHDEGKPWARRTASRGGAR